MARSSAGCGFEASSNLRQNTQLSRMPICTIRSLQTTINQPQCSKWNMDSEKEEDGISPSQEIDFCTLGMFIIGKNSTNFVYLIF